MEACASLFDTRASLEQFGISDYYGTGYRRDGSFYIKTPPELQGDYEDSLSVKFNWTSQFRKEFQFKRRFDTQIGICRSGSHDREGKGLDQKFFPVAYPNISKEYEMENVCADSIKTRIRSRNRNVNADSGVEKMNRISIFDMMLLLLSLIIAWYKFV